MKKELMELKEGIKNLYDIILDLSAGLQEMNTNVDGMLMKEMGISPSESIEMTHTELPQSDTEPPAVRGRPKTRHSKDMFPESKEQPIKVETPPEARIPSPVLSSPAKAPETPQKQSVMERLLGKDASEKQRQRAERMAQLEKELAELGQKK